MDTLKPLKKYFEKNIVNFKCLKKYSEEITAFSSLLKKKRGGGWWFFLFASLLIVNLIKHGPQDIHQYGGTSYTNRKEWLHSSNLVSQVKNCLKKK